MVKDFLYHCFQKDPNLRITAKKLLRHPWMASARKNLEKTTSTPSIEPQPKLPRSSSSRPGSLRAGTPVNGSKLVPKNNAGGDTLKAKKPITVYDEAVQRVQEWNEALNGELGTQYMLSSTHLVASPKALGTVRRLPSTSAVPRKSSGVKRIDSQGPLGLFGLAPLPSRNSNESVASQSSKPAAVSASQSTPGGLLQKNLDVVNVLSQAKEESEDAWDDDFASDISVTKLNRNLPKKEEQPSTEESDQKTLRPSKSSSPLIQTQPLPTRDKSMSRSASRAMVEDYSDMALDSEVGDLETKLAHLKVSYLDWRH